MESVGVMYVPDQHRTESDKWRTEDTSDQNCQQCAPKRPLTPDVRDLFEPWPAAFHLESRTGLVYRLYPIRGKDQGNIGQGVSAETPRSTEPRQH